MNLPGQYEKYKDLPMQELCEIMAGYENLNSKANIARLIYEERQMEERHKNEKEQIELQHKFNMELMNKQVKWIKFSAILTAIVTLSAVVLGWYLSEMKQIKSPQQQPQTTLQSQTLSSPNDPVGLPSE